MNKPIAGLLTLPLFITFPCDAAKRSVVLEVHNMTCSVCPLTVKKALSHVDGVHGVEIDYENQVAIVSYDDTLTSTGKLTDATANAGYPSTVKNP